MKCQIANLEKKDLSDLLTLSHRSLYCKTFDDLKSLVSDIGQLFPFENAVCARGNLLELIKPNGHPLDIHVCDVSYPEGYLDLYFEKQFYYTDTAFLEFITSLLPVNWLSVDEKCGYNYPASVMALAFNMHDGWTHGKMDIETMDCTAFFFGGIKAEHNERCSLVLEYIIPFYAAAYERVLKVPKRPASALTVREIEVLNWVKEGKSSWEISQILHFSKRTVEFHIGNIKRKLGAVSRAQAVAMGLECGIIHF